MAIYEVDGYKFLDSYEKCIVMEEGKVEETIEYMVTNGIKSLYLCDFYFFGSTIDFLQKLDFIERLNISCSYIKDFQGLQYLKKLKCLLLNEPKTKIDFEMIPTLTELWVVMNKNVVGLEKLKKLKILGIWKYNPSSKSLIELRKLNELEELKITTSSIHSLDGCGELTKLRKLELSYLKNLNDIKELEKLSNSLKHLEVSSCKKVINHEFVVCLKNLEWLSFNECSDMKNINFINDMPNLKKFIFMNTNILDGNVEPCRRLEYTAFTNKRHFSSKCEEFYKK